MASTYTANSGIELITQGEKSGTWGDTTNNNLKIIDRNINQQLSLDLGSPVDYGGSTYTLTTTDGALSEGQYALLSLEGSPSGAVTIDIDPDGQQKIFFVANSCGQTVTFQQGDGTGGTSSVADGSSAIIYSDGAGTGAQVSQISFGILTSLNVSGAATLAGANTLSGATTTSGALTVSGDITIDGYHPTGTSNIAWGATALDAIISGAEYNIALGSGALTDLTDGDYNIALGYNSGQNLTTGTDNIVMGRAAGEDITTGADNIIMGQNSALNIATNSTSNISFGKDALSDTTNAVDYCVAVGEQALKKNEADNNIGIGYKANFCYGGSTSSYQHNIGIGVQSFGGVSTTLSSVVSQSGNIAIGYQAFGKIFQGDDNIAIGYQAGLGGTQGLNGSNNVFVGPRSGYSIENFSSNNTAVGAEALEDVTTGDNNVCIGYEAGTSSSPSGSLTTDNNTVCIGNSSITDAHIQVSWTVASDIRDKTNVGEVPLGLEFLSQVNPISYQFKESRDSDEAVGKVIYGYSAQDILAAEGSESVIVDASDSEHLKMTNDNIIPVLHNAILELKAENEALKARLDAAGI